MLNALDKVIDNNLIIVRRMRTNKRGNIKSKQSNKPLLDRFNWTKLITWVVILMITYVVWFKMVPGAIEYVMG